MPRLYEIVQNQNDGELGQITSKTKTHHPIDYNVSSDVWVVTTVSGSIHTNLSGWVETDLKLTKEIDSYLLSFNLDVLKSVCTRKMVNELQIEYLQFMYWLRFAAKDFDSEDEIELVEKLKPILDGERVDICGITSHARTNGLLTIGVASLAMIAGWREPIKVVVDVLFWLERCKSYVSRWGSNRSAMKVLQFLIKLENKKDVDALAGIIENKELLSAVCNLNPGQIKLLIDSQSRKE